MKPSQSQPQKSPEQLEKAPKSRFQIVKLEERIAPNVGGRPNGGVGNKGRGNYCGYASCGHHK